MEDDISKRNEIYSDLDKRMRSQRRRNALSNTKEGVSRLISTSYGKFSALFKKKENEESWEEEAEEQSLETYTPGEPGKVSEVHESAEVGQKRGAVSTFFTTLFKKIGIEKVDENTEVLDTTDSDEIENTDAKELLIITKELIKKLPEKEIDSFVGSEAYQKLKELNNKYK